MILTALIAGTLTAIGFVLLAMKFGKPAVLTLLGYAWLTDILITLGCITLFASSGTVSGLLAGIMTGLVASMILSLARKTLGYRKLSIVRRKWYRWTITPHDYEGDWAKGFKSFLNANGWNL